VVCEEETAAAGKAGSLLPHPMSTSALISGISAAATPAYVRHPTTLTAPVANLLRPKFARAGHRHYTIACRLQFDHVPVRIGDVGVRAFGLMLSALEQSTACSDHFLNGALQLAPVGQTKTEMSMLPGPRDAAGLC
jgi:hypothetical protein